MGDTVNVAQRMEALAEPGSVVVGAQTRELAGAGFDFRKLPVTQVKGRTEPVSPYQVVSERSIDPLKGSEGGESTPFVGRGDELQALMEAYKSACKDRRPVIVIVRGDAGSGKSRIFRELGSRLNRRPETVAIRLGRCASLGGGPFGPIGEIMKRRCGLWNISPQDERGAFLARTMKDLRKIAADSDGSQRYTETEIENFAHSLGSAVLGLEFPDSRVKSLDPAQFQAGLRIAFRAWLEALARDCPMVLVIEDMQWADE
jgi:predicted ATPase